MYVMAAKKKNFKNKEERERNEGIKRKLWGKKEVLKQRAKM
jgi:hypothetical protein